MVKINTRTGLGQGQDNTFCFFSALFSVFKRIYLTMTGLGQGEGGGYGIILTSFLYYFLCLKGSTSGGGVIQWKVLIQKLISYMGKIVCYIPLFPFLLFLGSHFHLRRDNHLLHKQTQDCCIDALLNVRLPHKLHCIGWTHSTLPTLHGL